MKKLLHILFLFSSYAAFGQIFTGTSTDKVNAYNCTIRINQDSTVNFVYHSKGNGIYAEHEGRIVQLNDSLFHIDATLTIGQFYMKSYHEDTLYIKMDSTIALYLDKILVAYSNGSFKNYQGYDSIGNSLRHLKIPIDKTIFNAKKGNNFVNITINRRNLITYELLSFEIPFGAAVWFTKGEKLAFDVIIKNEQITTTALPPLQTGHFRLKIDESIIR